MQSVVRAASLGQMGRATTNAVPAVCAAKPAVAPAPAKPVVQAPGKRNLIKVDLC